MNTRHKQKTQKLLHRFFNNAPKSTDTKLKAQKNTTNTKALSRLSTSLHTAYIQTTLRIKQKKSQQVSSRKQQVLNLVKRRTHTKENYDSPIQETHHNAKRNTTGSVLARSIKKFTRWRQTADPLKNNSTQLTGVKNMGKFIGK